MLRGCMDRLAAVFSHLRFWFISYTLDAHDFTKIQTDATGHPHGFLDAWLKEGFKTPLLSSASRHSVLRLCSQEEM